jgi:hypothetical protein
MTSKAKDRFPNYESICFQCGATIYKPYRELTDGEILNIYLEQTNGNKDLDILEFARAILKKASEK